MAVLLEQLYTTLLATNNFDYVLELLRLADDRLGGQLSTYIVAPGNGDRDTQQQLEQLIYYPLQALHGSVSAEQGIGLEKKAYLSYCRSPEEIQLMRTLKQALDSHNILNPGKIFDL